ncbi:MAG: putative tryptophan/tyrosine transport system substrate-binding protein [Candidatus Dependentiae bacterium]|nr:putative tryptophan/tyrosine transport system substrate-binding protein [Candidatus Dependentiae bacterium]
MTKKKSFFIGFLVTVIAGIFIGRYVVPYKDLVMTRKLRKNVAIVTKHFEYHQQVLHGALTALGLEQRVHLVPHVYTATGDQISEKNIVEEAIAAKPDLVLAIGAGLAQVTKNTIQKRRLPIPLVFAGATDPVALGLVDSVEVPGCNVTGSNMLPYDRVLMVKYLLLLLPHIKRIGLPYTSQTSSVDIEIQAQEIKEYCAARGVEVVLLPIDVPEANGLQLVQGIINQIDALIYLPICYVCKIASGLVKLCAEHHVVLCAGDESAFANDENGAPFSYGPRAGLTGKYAAEQVKKILAEGESATRMPIQYVERGCRFAINLNALKKQNIAINSDLLLLISHGEVLKDGVAW